MKRILSIALVALAFIGLANISAQAQTIDGKLHQFYPSDFNKWTIVATNSVGATTATAILSAPTVSQITANGGGKFNPLAVNSTMLINNGGTDSETVTITAVSTPNPYTFTAVFGTAHTGRFNVNSGTYGLQEALDAAVASANGGLVYVEPTYPGTTAMITSLVRGSASVPVVDRRNGHNDWYLWSGSAYVSALVNAPGANGASLNVLTKTVVVDGAAAATLTATSFIPAGSTVLGLVSYVTSTFSNTSLTSMKIGDGTTTDKFSSATMALVAGTVSNSETDGNKTAQFYSKAATSVVITGNGANFAANGHIRLVLFYTTVTPPTS